MERNLNEQPEPRGVFGAGVRAMRAVHALGGTVRDIAVVEAALRDLSETDPAAATVLYAWYEEIHGEEEKEAA